LSGSREHIIKRKLLMIIPIFVVSMAFARLLGTSAIPAGATGGSVPQG
jgi:hypothetical protein